MFIRRSLSCVSSEHVIKIKTKRREKYTEQISTDFQCAVYFHSGCAGHDKKSSLKAFVSFWAFRYWWHETDASLTTNYLINANVNWTNFVMTCLSCKQVLFTNNLPLMLMHIWEKRKLCLTCVLHRIIFQFSLCEQNFFSKTFRTFHRKPPNFNHKN